MTLLDLTLGAGIGELARYVVRRGLKTPQIRKEHTALSLGQSEIIKSPDHGTDKGAQRGSISGNGKGNVGGARQEFPYLLDRIELRFVHINYGGAANLQLTTVLPAAFSGPNIGQRVTGFGDVELAAKYKFLRQDEFGLDVAIFPRAFLPPHSDPALGSKHAALFIPLFAQKGWENWSIFGGGGCTINRGGRSRDFCQMSLVTAYRIVPELQLGVEVRHQTPDQEGAMPSTGLGFGAIYDLGARYHLMAWVGHEIQNANSTDQVSWYAALQFTY